MRIVEMFFGTSESPKTPRKVWWFLKIAPFIFYEYVYDFARYIVYSASIGLNSKYNLRARITETFHNIEKGLSLPNPRPGFGQQAVDRLLSLCDRYIEKYSENERVLYVARDVLKAYKNFNEACGTPDFPHRDRVVKYIERMSASNLAPVGGLLTVTKADIQHYTSSVSLEFFKTRYSVRQFSEKDVDVSLIENAISVALKAPAVCNRQYSRAVVITEPKLVQQTLKMQGGARGFGEGVNKLIVVTNRLSQFWGSGERNQVWIDGGLFAMSLLLGLHAQCLGACCLNWSKDNAQTRSMKTFLRLDDDEVIIMMIAVGHLRDDFSVAVSNRVSVEDGSRLISDLGSAS